MRAPARRGQPEPEDRTVTVPVPVTRDSELLPGHRESLVGLASEWAAAGGSESAAAAGTGSDSDHDDVASYCQCGSGRWLAGCSGNGSARILGSAAGSGRVTPIPQTEYVVRNGAKNSIR